MRLIDADAATEKCKEPTIYDLEDVPDFLKYDCPTIDAEPVRHGKLVSTGVCTLHCEIGGCVVCKGLNIVGAKYCQWCGAKLDGGEADGN